MTRETDLELIERAVDATVRRLERRSDAIVDGRSDRSLFDVEKRITRLTTFKHYIGLKREFEVGEA